MKQFDSYWKLWQMKGGSVVRSKVEEPLLVEYSEVETKLLIGSTHVKVFPFLQDEESGWYMILPPGFDGERVEMWFDKGNGVIYTVASDALVEILAINIIFTQLDSHTKG